MENNYRINLDLLEKKLEENKDCDKLIIYNNPSNPTGLIYSDKETETISKLLRKYNCVIFADEIYMNLTYN